jgi:hypothetical protein
METPETTPDEVNPDEQQDDQEQGGGGGDEGGFQPSGGDAE